MVSKITSLNSQILFEPLQCMNGQRWVLAFLLLPLLLGVNVVNGQPPVFTNPAVCPGATAVTINQTLSLATSAEIEAALGVMANDPDGGAPVTFSASPTSITCADIGGPVLVTVTATDDETDMTTCNIVVTVNEDTPTAMCTNISINLDGAGNYTLSVADENAITAGTISCSPVTYNFSQSAFDCTDLGPVNITVTPTNNAGAGASCNAIVTVNDNLQPVAFPNLNANNSASNCLATVSWPIATTDNCAGSVNSTITSITDPKMQVLTFITSGSNYSADFPVGVSTVNYMVTDGTNPLTSSFTVTVTDIETPVLNCATPQNIFIRTCNAANELIPNFLGLASVTDNCSGNLMLSQSPNFGVGQLLSSIGGVTPMQGESFVVTITASDNNPANDQTCNITVNIQENDDPIPSTPGGTLASITNNCGDLTLTAPTAVDACGNVLCGVPFPATGITDLGPTCGAPLGPCNPISRTSPTATPGTPVPIPDNTPGGVDDVINISTGDLVIEDIEVEFDITHTWVGDLEVQLIKDGQTVTLIERPGLPAFSVNFGCIDDNLSLVFNDDPGSLPNSVFDIAGNCNGDDPAYSSLGTDFQPKDALATFAANNVSPNGDWTLRVIDNAAGDTGTLDSWTLRLCTNTGSTSVTQYLFPVDANPYNITWVYDDGLGNSETQLQQIMVNADTQAPTFNCQNVTVELDAAGMASITPDDVLESASITITSGSGSSNNAGIGATEFSYTATTAVTFSWDWSYLNNDCLGCEVFGYAVNGIKQTAEFVTSSGSESVTLGVGDVFNFYVETFDNFGPPGIATITNFVPGFAGDYSLNNWTLTNTNTPFIPGSVTSSPGEASDNCSLSSNLAFSLSTSTFNCNDIGNNGVILTVTDEAGNPGTCNVTVTVEDNIDPTITGTPANISTGIDCTNIPAPPTIGIGITASDNCTVTNFVFNETSTKSGNPTNCTDYNYTLTRTWTAIDQSANITITTQTIDVADTTPPTATLAGSQTVAAAPTDPNCIGAATVALSAVSDNCAPNNLTVTFQITFADLSTVSGSGSSVTRSDFQLGDNTVTFVIVDPCGNSLTIGQTVTVTDQTPPVASCNAGPFNIGLPASGVLVIPPSLLNNGSFDNCHSVTASIVPPNSFDCSHADGVTQWPLTLVVVDDVNGDQSTCSSSVIIQDNTDPEAICMDIVVALDENGVASISESAIDNGSNDNCDMSLDYNTSITNFDVNDIGPNPVSLLVTDDSGNNDIAFCTVTVTPPVTCFNIGEAFGSVGETVSVPITIENFDALISFQYTLQDINDLLMPGSDSSVIEIVGVSNIHPALSSGFINQLLADSTFNPIDTLDELDMMNNPVYPPLDSIVFDTLLQYQTISVSWLGSSATTIADGTTIFNVDVMLTGQLGQITYLMDIPSINNTPSEIVYDFGGALVQNMNPCFEWDDMGTNPGGEISINALDIAGTILNENGVGVNLADVILEKDDGFFPLTLVDTDITDIDGNYDFRVNQGGDYYITPFKDINWENGVDILDVAGIQRHAVGNMFVGTAYKKIAADVSDDGLITTFDAVLLNQFLANGFDPSFTPPNLSWRFVDAEVMLTYLENAPLPPEFTPGAEIRFIDDLSTDSLRNDFVGVKIGDIGGNPHDPSQLVNGDTRSNIQFVIKDQALKAGEVYDFEVNAKNFADMIGYQWVLDFNANHLDFKGIQAASLKVGDANVGLNFLDQGMIILTWYDAYATSIDEEDVLFTLSFQAKEDVTRISDLFNIGTFETVPAVAYDELQAPYDIELIFEENEVEPTPSEFALYQNQPNPFKSESVISFRLPESTTATLTLTDISGRVLQVLKGDFAQGYNQVTIDRSQLPAVGIVYYELSTKSHTATKKMVILE